MTHVPPFDPEPDVHALHEASLRVAARRDHTVVRAPSGGRGSAWSFPGSRDDTEARRLQRELADQLVGITGS